MTNWNMRPLGVQVIALAYRTGESWNESVCDPAWTPDDPKSRLAVVLLHIDLVTLTPKTGHARPISRRFAVGLDDRDIVTLAGLIAFVDYQVLVAAGLRMLREH
jgi:uncharacterized protein YciW